MAAVVGLAALALSLLPLTPAVAAGPADDLEHTLAERVGDVVGTAATGAAVVVTQGDRQLLAITDGYSDAKLTEPFTLQTRTPVASVSKMVTALSAITLDAEGAIDLSADLRRADSVDLVDERAEGDRAPVTGWNILTHHAGLAESILLFPDASGVTEDQPLAAWVSEHPPVLRYASSGMHYSALQGHTLLGSVMESATGQTFDDIVTETVFARVGADTASYREGPADAELSAPTADGWTPTPWPFAPERPASALVWSANDAEAVLRALSPESDALASDVRAAALSTAVIPAHGGTGHTGVFFDEVREGVRVLEHTGANGVARIAYMPDADIGVYVSTTSEQAAAAEMTDAVIDDVARWVSENGFAGQPIETPREPVQPSWVPDASSADPSGLFAERLFLDQPFERGLRALLGQVAVSLDGDVLRIGGREYTADSTNRWCSPDGCVTAVRTEAGEVQLLRGDRGMLEQTLDPVPWWRDASLVLVSLASIPVLGAVVLGAGIRAAVRGRRGEENASAPSRLLAGIWAGLAALAAVGSVALPLLPLLDAQTFAPFAPNSPALIFVSALVVVAASAGFLWVVSAGRAWRKRRVVGRIITIVGAVLGVVATFTLVDWTLIPAGA
ncbi:serine hydrolase domain-containing protein [Microbacterium sp. LS_15]|uniref:serine hydrolase domain-containing protein n=1 Tax=Microbacterium sp. LS_15 TaxID=3055790 RepID=UPI0035BFF6EB